MSCIVTLLQPVVVCPEIGATGREVAGILHLLAANIDARQFNPTFPATFPRFVQSAIWRYCAEDGLDICNGNRVLRAKPCDHSAETAGNAGCRNGRHRRSAYGWSACSRCRIPVLCKKLCTRVSTATNVAPTSTHSGRRPAANSKSDNAIANTLSETP